MKKKEKWIAVIDIDPIGGWGSKNPFVSIASEDKSAVIEATSAFMEKLENRTEFIKIEIYKPEELDGTDKH